MGLDRSSGVLFIQARMSRSMKLTRGYESVIPWGFATDEIAPLVKRTVRCDDEKE